MSGIFADRGQLTKVAFRFIKDIYKLPDPVDTDLDSLVRRVQGIHAGLSAEKEFFALVSWLGQCPAIHAIEHLKMPVENDEQLRPADFKAVSKYNGQLVPVLIEVKTTDDESLIWSGEYIGSLREFADLLRLPLLVAWKWHDIWALTDVCHFQKHVTAYHLPWETALRESLMNLLFGDVMVVLKESFQLILECAVAEDLPDTPLIPEGTYTLTIKDAGFFIGGKRIQDLPSEQMWLFMASPESNFVERLDRNLVRIIHHPEGQSSFPMFQVLLTQLVWHSPAGAGIDWNEEISKGPLPSSGTRFREVLHDGLKLGTVRYVLQQVPHAMPSFLQTFQNPL